MTPSLGQYFAEAIFQHAPIMRQLIANRTADSLELSNDISVEVRPASFRSLRGPTYVAAICDEAAFWLAENGGSVNPDIAQPAPCGITVARWPLGSEISCSGCNGAGCVL